MIVRPFTTDDYDMMVRWYKHRDLRPPQLEMLPKIGFIVPGIAATFLYMMENNLSWSDGTITNLNASRSERQEAIVKLFEEIEKAAKAAGIKYILSSTKLPVMVEYAKNAGWKVNEGSTSILKRVR